jgi:hypothetical protein
MQRRPQNKPRNEFLPISSAAKYLTYSLFIRKLFIIPAPRLFLHQSVRQETGQLLAHLFQIFQY